MLHGPEYQTEPSSDVPQGRSAYEPIQSSEADDQSDQTRNETAEANESSGYAQAFDEKGNPTNPEISRRNGSQIAAKNEVLAAVGVCERKNSEARRSKLVFSEEEWKVIVEGENGIGETGRIVAECFRHGASWWLVALRKRLQSGIISSSEPFSQILSHEWHLIANSGVLGGFNHIMVGVVPEITGQGLSILLEWIIEELHVKAYEIPFRLRLRRGKRQKMLRYIDNIKIGTLVISQLLLSPFAISAALQQLGLVESLPFSELAPWNPLSPLRWAWGDRADALPLGSRLLSTLLSPASLWCLSNTLYQIVALNYGSTPFCPESLILGPSDYIRKPHSIDWWSQKEPHSLLKPLANLRDSILCAIGWSEPRPQSDELFYAYPTNEIWVRDTDTIGYEEPTETTPTKRPHRDTELARLPSHFLALNIDTLVNQIVFLPLESLYLRSLVSSFLASPLATRGVRHYPPGRGPIGALLSSGVGPSDWKGAGAYANKIGLCMGLQFSIDTAIWAGAYAWTRNMGLKRYHWGAL